MAEVLLRCSQEFNNKCTLTSRQALKSIVTSFPKETLIYTLMLLILKTRRQFSREIIINHIILAGQVDIELLVTSKRTSTRIIFRGHNRSKISDLKLFPITNISRSSRLKISILNKFLNRVLIREEIRATSMRPTQLFLPQLFWWIRLPSTSHLNSLLYFWLQRKRHQVYKKNVPGAMWMWSTVGLASANKMYLNSRWISHWGLNNRCGNSTKKIN